MISRPRKWFSFLSKGKAAHSGGTVKETVVRTEVRKESTPGDIQAFLHIVRLYPDAVKWYLYRKKIYGLKITRYADGADAQWDTDTLNTLLRHKDFILSFIHYLPERQRQIDTPPQKKDITPPDDGTARPQVCLDGVSTWPCTADGIRYRYLHDYLSLKYDRLIPPEMLSRFFGQAFKVRQLVWHFKYDLENPKPVRHAVVVKETAKEIAALLNATFCAVDRDEIVFVCIPASSQQSYLLRFREFSHLVCRLTGMIDGMDGIHIIGNKVPRHMGGKKDIELVTDEEMFRGKHIILFDDVLTTGGTVRKYAAYFNRFRAQVIGAVFIARTLGPEDIDRWKSQNPASGTQAPSGGVHTDPDGCSWSAAAP